MVATLENRYGEVFETFLPGRITALLATDEDMQEFLRHTGALKITGFDRGLPVLEFYARPLNPEEAVVPAAAQQNDNLCEICLTREREVVFNCGHRSCSRCSTRIVNCFLCRERITQRIRFF